MRTVMSTEAGSTVMNTSSNEMFEASAMASCIALIFVELKSVTSPLAVSVTSIDGGGGGGGGTMGGAEGGGGGGQSGGKGGGGLPGGTGGEAGGNGGLHGGGAEGAYLI